MSLDSRNDLDHVKNLDKAAC